MSYLVLDVETTISNKGNPFDKTNKPSIYISHGTQDEVIPFEESINTNKILDDKDIEYEFKSFNQGHGVSSENLESFLDWLKNRY